MRVLIVEDDLEASAAMTKGLTEAGHECANAADGEIGLAWRRSAPIASMSSSSTG